MNDRRNTLQWLVEPHSEKKFCEVFQDGGGFLVCGEPTPKRFKGLLSLGVLDSILGTSGVQFPDVRLVRSDADVPAAEYTWASRLVDPMRVGHLFTEGCTVIFGAVHHYHEPVRRLCTELSGEMGCRTQANVYLTPPTSQGFNPHWDTHDVFVIQVEGKKRWRIYDGGVDLPVRTQKFKPGQSPVGTVVDDFLLNAGEVLFIPRGLMHAAETREEASLHITLGVIAYTWADLVADCVSEVAERDREWRRNIPLMPNRGNDGEVARLRQEFSARLQELRGKSDVEAVVEARLSELSNAHRPRAHDHLRQAVAAGELKDSDWVKRRPGLPFRMESMEDEVVVCCGNREIGFPLVARRTLDAVLRQGPVRVDKIDDDLDISGRKVAVAALIREGVVVRSPNSTR